MKKILVLLVIITLIFVNLNIGFGNNGRGIYQIALEGEISSLDPNEMIYSEVTGFLYEGLYTLKNGEVVSAMAESYSVSEDGLVHTFTIGQRYWSDGTPVTAQDFVNGWNRIPENELYADYDNHVLNYFNVDSYYALGDKTFEVTLTAPTSSFFTTTSNSYLSPYKSEGLYNGRYIYKPTKKFKKLKQNQYYYDTVKCNIIIIYENIAFDDYEKGFYDMYLTQDPWLLNAPYEVSDSRGSFVFLLNPDTIDLETRQMITKALMEESYPSQFRRVDTETVYPQTLKSPYSSISFDAAVDQSHMILTDLSGLEIEFVTPNTPIHLAESLEVQSILLDELNIVVNIEIVDDWAEFSDKRNGMDYDIVYFGWLVDRYTPDDLLSFYSRYYDFYDFDLSVSEVDYDAYVQDKINELIGFSTIVPISEYTFTYLAKDSNMVKQEANGVFWFK